MLNRSKVPSTLQYTAQTTKRRNVRNPDHSKLIQTQEKWEMEKKKESRNKGAAFWQIWRLQEETGKLGSEMIKAVMETEVIREEEAWSIEWL